MYGSPAAKDFDRLGAQRKQEPDLFQPATATAAATGLLRYRSAPISLFGDVEQPEADFARFLEADLCDHKPPQPPPQALPQHRAPQAPGHVLYHSQQMHQGSGAMDGGLFGGMDAAGAGGVGLVRQSSSPAGLFNHLRTENGFGGMIRGGAAGGGELGRLKRQLSYSSRQGSLMSQISETMESDDMGCDDMGCHESRASGSAAGGRWAGAYSLGGSWDDSPAQLSDGSGMSGMKRVRDHAGSEPQVTSAVEMSAVDKFLHFQEAVPCKIRAKRGCATHPRSIAERVRRTRISERIRKLQELVPNMDKQTNTADMLDLAVEYIKDLQKQVKVLNECRAGCTCDMSRLRS